MPARQKRTYSTPEAAHAKVLAAREELMARAEPMRRWPHPIPQCDPPRREEAGEVSASEVQALELLQYQNQVLTDLLGAVNSLTAAVLCQKAPAPRGEV